MCGVGGWVFSRRKACSTMPVLTTAMTLGVVHLRGAVVEDSPSSPTGPVSLDENPDIY
jgi:hypothetical protein